MLGILLAVDARRVSAWCSIFCSALCAFAYQDFTAFIAVHGQKPEGYLLRGRSLAALTRQDGAGTPLGRGGTDVSL